MNSQKTFLTIILATASFTLACLGIYSYEQYFRVLPADTMLESISLEGLNRSQAVSALDQYLSQLSQKKYAIVLDEEHSKEFSNQELGIQYDAQKTISNIFHHSAWYVRLLSADFSPEAEEENQHRPVISFDQEKIEQVIKEYLISKEKDFENADIVWSEKSWIVRDEQPGIVAKEGEFERVFQQIITSAQSSESFPAIQVAYESVPPMRTRAEVEPFLQNVSVHLHAPITLVFEKEKTDMSFADDSEWVKVDLLEKSIKLNEDFLQQWVKTYAEARNVAPGQVQISAVEEHISEYDRKPYKKAVYSGDFTHGKTIDQAKITEALKHLFADAALERTIVVEWEEILPTITSQLPEYQFPQILSTGISSYRYGNHPNRVKNIKLSLGSFQGIVVNPGEEFSFNRITGWITPNKGYTKTQVIMEGRVEEGVGGGVCQSSTTMYRSILNAGVQVTERRNHTLDIIYYHEYGYGLDATVYTDSRNDLKFINNFPGPILINTYTEDGKQLAHVEFYGTTDERRVELTQINTGDYLLKKWNWNVIWPDRNEEKTVLSRYQVPKEEEKAANPLEG